MVRGAVDDGQFDDYGDGKADLSVFRAASGNWYTLKSGLFNAAVAESQFGLFGDLPVQNDYDGDGRSDFAVFRPAGSNWFVLLSSSDFTTFTVNQWGLDEDVPIRPNVLELLRR